MADEVCIGCGHSLGNHFQDVTGKVRCLFSSSGTSSEGVLGMPWAETCDCINYGSERTTHRKIKEAAEKAEWDKHMQRLFDTINLEKQ